MANNLLEARIHNKLRTQLGMFLYRHSDVIKNRYNANVVIEDNDNTIMIEHKNGIDVVLPYIIDGELKHDYVVDQFVSINEIKININSIMKIAIVRCEDPIKTMSKVLEILGKSLVEGIYHQPLAVKNMWKQYQLEVVQPNRI